MRLILTLFFSLFSIVLFSQEVAILKYKGGGDWYSNPTALPNLVKYCNDNIDTNINENIQTVEAGSIDIFQFPFLHMTGHGNVFFSEDDAENLRNYLMSGGFLHIDDNYGMEPYVTKELKKVFPNKSLIEIPKNHKIFSSAFNFPNGLPKIHEHDGKAPKAYGIFQDERLILLFTFESDLGDGWEDSEVHNDPEEVREKALKMGANIIKYAFEH
ncbi:DUF4159 domain-containing protein [Winogradskyella sediminis]|uniref:DUF4159 domain-containing protein n=1 Tax=Winogradskyella sediminis TaxID=1382466 RepID=A0A1H1WTB3_9FLAO|nr:DUF4159 domain-containing protein [Winogradskyella sediminis]REG88124.1 uncharacterized protein DUF4159 [Winogradskyella sediminis]SDT00302.1 protein of unknown function [Winogradskyella sediminis]